MKKEICTRIARAAAAFAVIACFFAASAEAQVRLNPKPLPSMSIKTDCEADRAVFKIRNGLQPWPVAGEIIVIDEEQRRIVSRRSMRFASNQKATYRVPLTGIYAAQGPLRVVLVMGEDEKKPIAHARLDCRES